MHVLYIYMPRVYVAFILDMIIIFNKIINNSRPPAWYFSLTRTGSKEFTIVGLTKVRYKAGGSGRAARAMALPHFRLSDHVTLNG